MNKGEGFSHLDDQGNAHMVNVGAKPLSERTAVAEGEIRFSQAVLERLTANDMKKGDVYTVSKIAGIMGAKRTSELIPLCHGLNLSHIDLEITLDADSRKIVVRSETRTCGQTGVEMEALTAVSVALLTLYDMMKAVDKAMEIGGIRLVRKTGGRSEFSQVEK